MKETFLGKNKASYVQAQEKIGGQIDIYSVFGH